MEITRAFEKAPAPCVSGRSSTAATQRVSQLGRSRYSGWTPRWKAVSRSEFWALTSWIMIYIVKILRLWYSHDFSIDKHRMKPLKNIGPLPSVIQKYVGAEKITHRLSGPSDVSARYLRTQGRGATDAEAQQVVNARRIDCVLTPVSR